MRVFWWNSGRIFSAVVFGSLFASADATGYELESQALSLSDDNVTASPTIHVNVTSAPTVAPTQAHNDTNITTSAPTSSPTLPPTTPPNHTTLAPTATPTRSPTRSPTHSPTRSPTRAPTCPPTPKPTTSPTTAPTSSPSGYKHHHHKLSFWRILGKTIAWCIIILLVFLGFGAIMSNRYRIFYFLRGVWYTILAMDCTQYIIRKATGRDYHPVDASLNTIIFESNNEMTDGLLMRETD